MGIADRTLLPPLETTKTKYHHKPPSGEGKHLKTVTLGSSTEAAGNESKRCMLKYIVICFVCFWHKNVNKLMKTVCSFSSFEKFPPSLCLSFTTFTKSAKHRSCCHDNNNNGL